MADEEPWVAELEDLADLHSKGALTDEEFEAAKAKLLTPTMEINLEAVSPKLKAVLENRVEEEYRQMRSETLEGYFIAVGSIVILGFILAFALGWCELPQQPTD